MMLLLKSPQGDMVCVRQPEGWDNDVVSLGYPEWTILETREDSIPEYANWVEGQGFVVDEDAKALALEEARLNCLTAAERQDEAVAKATTDILNALIQAGTLSPIQANNILNPGQ
jgi:hypothetical protein